jgi:hypothetical protein
MLRLRRFRRASYGASVSVAQRSFLPGGDPMSEQRLSTILAFCFGVVFLAALLAIVIIFPNPTDRQFEIIRTVLALAAGGVAAAIPGLLNLQLGTGSKLAIRAGGAIAVFVIVYFYSPAHWTGSTSQHTEGANSPAIIGNNNIVAAPVKP